jgi:hypothetical protein
MLMLTPKEAEQAGYQATQVTALQQAGSVPVSEMTETAQIIETPMDIDEETKGAASGMKRKAEEEPGEDSKKARVGVCVRTENLRRQLTELCRATPHAQTVSLISSDHPTTDINAILQRPGELHRLRRRSSSRDYRQRPDSTLQRCLSLFIPVVPFPDETA